MVKYKESTTSFYSLYNHKTTGPFDHLEAEVLNRGLVQEKTRERHVATATAVGCVLWL